MGRTPEQISRNMRAIKSKDTKPELLLRKELWKRGLRYRKNCRMVIGTPDIVFLRTRIAVFVDGSVWHGYDWQHHRNDFKSNREFWISKIEENMQRDHDVMYSLTELGWCVLRFWDFEIRENVAACADRVEEVYLRRTHRK